MNGCDKMSNELMHYGVKGMKWGVRKKDRPNKESSEPHEKLHLGIDKHGDLSLIRGKTTSEAKKAFAIKSLLFIGSIALTTYLSTHPRTIENGRKKVDSLINNPSLAVKKSEPVMSGIFSKTLGRELTIAEALEAGFDLSD